jgi:hypothetical protein
VFKTIWSDECGDVALVSSRERKHRGRKPTLVVSSHASERLEQRSIGGWAIQIAIEFGERFYAGKGCEVAYLSRRALRAAKTLLGQQVAEAENLAVVISNDGTVVTAYRAKRPLKHWRGEW